MPRSAAASSCRTPSEVCKTSLPRSPCRLTDCSPICPTRNTGWRVGSSRANASWFPFQAASNAWRTALSAPKKRSAGTALSRPWWGRKWL